MKACKFCGTRAEDAAPHCPSCGSSVFLHICENCGQQFDSGFCPNCGVKAGQLKKTCPDCGSAYFTNACPNCGYTPSRKPVVQKVEQTVVHKHIYEKAPETAASPRQTKKKGKRAGCLTWIIILLVIAALFGNRSSSNKSSSGYTTSTAKTTARVTKDPSVTAAPTATPEPAVAAAQEKVDQYFAKADEAEIAAVRDADFIVDRYSAKEQNKVVLVKRGWDSYDRGTVGTGKLEPSYIGSLGYAAVYEDQLLEKDPAFSATPWKIPVYRKDKQFWEEAGTIDHKTEVVVIGQQLEMPKRTSRTARCSGYLHVIRMDTGEDCWLDVENYVSSPYWEKGLTDALESGYCIATFRQVSDYYPVTNGNKKAELEDGTLVLLPMAYKLRGSSPDKENNPVPGVVFRQWEVSYGGLTVWFNNQDLTLTY